jgi:DNA invertase Pin-like site-specific DNA recombinase
MSATPLAFSYIRFSSTQQAEGDSLRRQTEAAADWCRQHNVTLDTVTKLRDLGRSAYTGAHRQNPDRNALAAFLKLVEQGKVPRGSYLIIENLDRLSREHIQPALLLALNLLQAGIRIVQLKPAEMIFDDKSDTLPVMMMMMELSRGHGESAIKSERNGAAWDERRRAMREDGDVLTRRLPAWITERGGKLALIPERANAIKRIYQLTAAGYGQSAILKKLIQEKVRPFGPSGHWARSYIALLLSDRRVVGEFQPRRHGKADGDPIPNYYPAAVTEDEWLTARGAASQRRHLGTRPGKHDNLFARLIIDALSGETYLAATQGGRKGAYRALVNASALGGTDKYRSFPLVVFEEAVLSLLAEIDPQEILNGNSGPDESLALAGDLARVEASIAVLNADMDEHGESPTLMKRVREKEAKAKVLAAKLAAAKQKAANPLSESWGEAQTLLEALDSAPDPKDARLRLRAVLRRIIESIQLLVVRRGGRDCLAAVQIWFAGGKRQRSYLVFYRPGSANAQTRRKASWKAHSLASVADPAELDLRRREDASALEAELLEMDLADLEKEDD